MEGNNLIKKGLVFAVIFLFFSVSVIPSTGTTNVKQITMSTLNGNTQYIGGNEGEKPDLVITDIFKKTDLNDLFSDDCLYVKVLNDGDVAVGNLKIRTIIERLLFNSIVIRTVYNHTTWYGNVNPLFPGEEWNLGIFQGKFFFPGFYIIHTIVNPDKDIDEYYYSNNERYERFFGRGIIFWR